MTPASGISAGLVSINPQVIQDWTTRFQNCFEEFRILKVVFDISPLGVNTGNSAFWIDDGSYANVPSSVEALSKPSRIVPNSNANGRSVFRMTWTAKDFSDLSYSRTTTVNNTVAALNYYTDITNYGSSGTNTSLFTIRPMLTIQFRGIAPVGGL